MAASLLAHDRVTAGAAAPGRWVLILHGIFGAGRNWATVARRLVEARPDWGVALVDLRQHGASQGFPPPHTVAAAAADLDGVAGALDGPVEAVVGHSFGGKVALAWAAAPPAGLRQAWMMDSTPDTRPPSGSAWEMLQAVREMPPTFTGRVEAVAALEARGVDTPVAQWMATNLEREAEGLYRWRFEPAAIEDLLRDFFQEDLWNVVERPPAGVDVHLVKATRSWVLTDEAVARIEASPAALHTVASGHWVNADAPDAVVALLAEHLPGGGGS